MPTKPTASAMVTYRGEDGVIPAYVARPTAGGARPGVVVIHDFFGLGDHAKDIADRFARAGYPALAPDLFGSPDLADVLTPANVRRAMQFMFRLPRRDSGLVEEELAKLPADERSVVAPTVRKLIGGLPKARFVKDLVNAVAFLNEQPSVSRGRVGCVGFCFGGGLSAELACEGVVQACVIFYGENPTPIARVRGIQGPVLGLYGGEDTRINAHLDELVRAMVESKKDFEMRIYPGAPHAFFNDTNGTTYREAAAKDAWDRVLRFYGRALGA